MKTKKHHSLEKEEEKQTEKQKVSTPHNTNLIDSDKLKAKKSKKKWIWVGVGIALFLILIIILSQKLRFQIKDELNIIIAPKEANIFMHDRADLGINFTIKNDNFAGCKSICSFSLVDLRDGKIVSNNSEILDRGQIVTKSYILTVPKKGEGQIMYNFDVKCSNIKSLLCSTDEEPRLKTALVTLNYKLSNEESAAKLESKTFLQTLVEKTSFVDTLIDEEKKYVLILPENVVERKEISLQIDALSLRLKEINDFRNKLIELWNNENYYEIKSQIENNKSDETLNKVELIANEVLILQDLTKESIIAYNLNLKILDEINQVDSFEDKLIDYYSSEINTNNAERIKSIYGITKLVEKEYLKIKLANKNEVYSIYEMNKTLIGLKNSFIEANSKNEIVVYLGSAEQKFLQALNGAKEEHVKNLPIASLNNSNSTLQTNLTNVSFVNIGTEQDSKEFSCDNLKIEISKAEKLNIESSSLKEMYYNWSIGNKIFEENLAKASDLLEIEALKNAINSSNGTEKEILKKRLYEFNSSFVKKWKNQNSIGILDVTSFKIDENATINVTKEEFFELGILKFDDAKKYILENCHDAKFANSTSGKIALSLGLQTKKILPVNISLAQFKELNVSLPKSDSGYTFTLNDNLATCCVYGKCHSCCDNKECRQGDNNKVSSYPVLFIHGHAFNNGNTPEYSMMSFAKLQNELQFDGFVNAGELEVGNKLEGNALGVWGKSKNPVTTRASYYYITHYTLGKYDVSSQNSERIENYAIRLKEIIQALKARTDSDKVVIVAHSMGGLVARQYVEIFGTSDVDRLIMIGTPNKGVNDKVYKGCTLLGSTNECDDMKQGSIFLSRLNSGKMPSDFRVYMIRANGCDMNGEDGDGIVTNSSAYFESAKNYLINGNCTDSMQTSLHTDVLDPNKYPKTIEILREILKE